ncbi:hypothetical protein BKA67DRAFT_523156 [Truncatella angustata]|uniref:Magnesium chelatase n=1 Tax=Truncatella angustata TaxID=152316 RepID=A0A9P8UFM0_9PEZI|nr:uncharacterized protein BKA67DRAFT_523156 [Truncatella angustata]KAH6649123.1 hypothetical protein BKA67DRAFT_523156 [Truncatella angustata]
MADEELLSKIHGLGDLDLAALLCLINREHCIISTEPEALDDLVEELQLVATETFKLRPALVSLTPDTTLDDFVASILLSSSTPSSGSPLQTRTASAQDSYFNSSLHPSSSQQRRTSGLSPLSQLSAAAKTTTQPSPQIANIILARDLDKAPKVVQIQALELLRTRRIFTRTSVQAAPKQFLFVAVLGAGSGGEARLTEHLNDFFYLAHWHDPLDGFVHLEERDRVITYDEDGAEPRTDSTDSDASDEGTLLSESDVTTLSLASCSVSVDVEVLRYQMNLISFLRMHRAVGGVGSVAPQATKHLDTLVRSMAVLHGLDFVTPALVALALRKVYLHRIRIVTDPRREERSMQWGSEVAAVEQLLEGVGPEEVMEDVIEMVDVPL